MYVCMSVCMRVSLCVYKARGRCQQGKPKKYHPDSKNLIAPWRVKKMGKNRKADKTNCDSDRKTNREKTERRRI